MNIMGNLMIVQIEKRFCLHYGCCNQINQSKIEGKKWRFGGSEYGPSRQDKTRHLPKKSRIQ